VLAQANGFKDPLLCGPVLYLFHVSNFTNAKTIVHRAEWLARDRINPKSPYATAAGFFVASTHFIAFARNLGDMTCPTN